MTTKKTKTTKTTKRPKALSDDGRRLYGFEYLIKWAARAPAIRRFTVSLSFVADGSLGTLGPDSTTGQDWYPLYRVAVWSAKTPKIVWVTVSSVLAMAAENSINRSGMKD